MYPPPLLLIKLSCQTYFYLFRGGRKYLGSYDQFNYLTYLFTTKLYYDA